jgi:shikimate dehydrogenase
MLSIRRATETDVDALVPLKASVHALHVERRPDFFKAMNLDEVTAWVRERFEEQTTHVWMAEDDGNPIGYMLATRRKREETPFSIARQWCEIEEVAIDESWRKRGIARALLERVVAHAHESGLDTVELSTWAFNEPAQAAFARMGFEPMLTRYELSGLNR